jgi:hypothetical protein
MEERIMDNEVMEVAEEIVPCNGSGIGGKLLIGAIVAGAGFGIYKLIKKFAAKKGTEYVEVEEPEDCGFVIDAEEVEELNEKLN